MLSYPKGTLHRTDTYPSRDGRSVAEQLDMDMKRALPDWKWTAKVRIEDYTYNENDKGLVSVSGPHELR